MLLKNVHALKVLKSTAYSKYFFYAQLKVNFCIPSLRNTI